MVALPDRTLMTAAEYLQWEPTQPERYEYWDGEIVAMSGGTRAHNRISGNCFKILDEALADRDCEVYIADVKVEVEPGIKYFYPDVAVTCDDRDDDPQFVRLPTLIVEVLSASTEAFDRGLKFAKYRQLPTLKEYVLVTVDRVLVEVFRRDDKDRWVLSEYNSGDRIYLESIAVEIGIDELYRQLKFDRDEVN
jgi:Uma2 family endonuclease